MQIILDDRRSKVEIIKIIFNNKKMEIIISTTDEEQ